MAIMTSCHNNSMYFLRFYCRSIPFSPTAKNQPAFPILTRFLMSYNCSVRLIPFYIKWLFLCSLQISNVPKKISEIGIDPFCRAILAEKPENRAENLDFPGDFWAKTKHHSCKIVQKRCFLAGLRPGFPDAVHGFFGLFTGF